MNQDVIAGLLGPWSAELGLGAILLRAALSVLFSAVIGCERSSKRHSAGLRTFILVSITGTAAMLTDRLLMEQIISTERCASEEIALLLSDCSTYEMMILLDVIKSLKASLKEHQGRYGEPDNFDFTV